MNDLINVIDKSLTKALNTSIVYLQRQTVSYEANYVTLLSLEEVNDKKEKLDELVDLIDNIKILLDRMKGNAGIQNFFTLMYDKIKELGILPEVIIFITTTFTNLALALLDIIALTKSLAETFTLSVKKVILYIVVTYIIVIPTISILKSLTTIRKVNAFNELLKQNTEEHTFQIGKILAHLWDISKGSFIWNTLSMIANIVILVLLCSKAAHITFQEGIKRFYESIKVSDVLIKLGINKVSKLVGSYAMRRIINKLGPIEIKL
jgi:hypothetical protein